MILIEKYKRYMNMAYCALLVFIGKQMLLDLEIDSIIKYQIEKIIIVSLIILLLYFAYKYYKTRKEKHKTYMYLSECAIIAFSLSSSKLDSHLGYQKTKIIIAVLISCLLYFSFKYYKAKKEVK